ncbi:mycofactocin biosynthesis peptidyl-dipeptidase MftE [Subtercola sp. YIM 133946]|uniref:mycofactocin biosynthesis peptidyl-dipeptidase MftE n=1 Tax=Subtercola sp. YIM 133946 TaxID=3118909 RepID=UPI002F92977E
MTAAGGAAAGAVPVAGFGRAGAVDLAGALDPAEVAVAFELAPGSTATLGALLGQPEGAEAPAASAPDARPTLLVPTGSTEQHGPHLPFGTDTVIAAAVAAAVAERLGASRPAGAPARPVVVAPALPYGASGEHQHFAGTLSIGHDALTTVLVELVRSATTWAGRIVFVNGHGGNVATLADTVTRMISEGHDVAWVACASPAAAAIVEAQRDSHAGRIETSLLLHLAAGTVDLARATPGTVAPLGELLPRLRAGGVAAVSQTGVLGDPTGASAAEGAALFASMVGAVADLVSSGHPDERGRLVPA